MTTTIANRRNINNRFGGLIYEFDFDTEYQGTHEDPPTFRGSMIASRIEKDRVFDKRCLKDAEIRDRRKKYKQECARNNEI